MYICNMKLSTRDDIAYYAFWILIISLEIGFLCGNNIGFWWWVFVIGTGLSLSAFLFLIVTFTNENYKDMLIRNERLKKRRENRLRHKREQKEKGKDSSSL